jgi:hypothetical protein
MLAFLRELEDRLCHEQRGGVRTIDEAKRAQRVLERGAHDRDVLRPKRRIAAYQALQRHGRSPNPREGNVLPRQNPTHDEF